MIQPVMSVIVIVFDMSDQFQNTLTTLTANYQRGVCEEEYEVIVVENSSANTLDREIVESLPVNFSYHLRQEQSQSPAAAINYGLQQARGEFVGLMIDGAHLLSPGVIALAKAVRAISDKAMVTVPTYHLGPDEQHRSTQQGYDESAQQRLLNSIDWRTDGYQLFSISSWCGANPRGYFAPIMESNCYFASRQVFEEIGGADTTFQQPGGGALNLQLTRKLGTLDGVEFFTMAGEGSFHQFHGGITSNQNRNEYEDRFNAELQQHWNNKYHFLERNPIIVGSIKPQALENMTYSSQKMLRRFDNCRTNQWEVWSDEK